MAADCEFLKTWSHQYQVICLYVLACLGTLGNLISLLVLVTSRIREKPIGQLLMCLSISDSLVLLFEALQRGGVADLNDTSCICINFIR